MVFPEVNVCAIACIDLRDSSVISPFFLAGGYDAIWGARARPSAVRRNEGRRETLASRRKRLGILDEARCVASVSLREFR